MLRKYSVEINVGLLCLLFLSVAFLLSCRAEGAPRAETSIEDSVNLFLRADAFATLKTSDLDFPKSIDVIETASKTIGISAEASHQTHIDGNGSFVVIGWAVDRLAEAAGSGAYLTIDGKRFVALYGLQRPDVATALKLPAASNSGFEAFVPAMSLTAGSHRVGLELVNAGRTAIYRSRSDVLISVSRDL